MDLKLHQKFIENLVQFSADSKLLAAGYFPENTPTINVFSHNMCTMHNIYAMHFNA